MSYVLRQRKTKMAYRNTKLGENECDHLINNRTKPQLWPWRFIWKLKTQDVCSLTYESHDNTTNIKLSLLT